MPNTRKIFYLQLRLNGPVSNDLEKTTNPTLEKSTYGNFPKVDQKDFQASLKPATIEKSMHFVHELGNSTLGTTQWDRIYPGVTFEISWRFHKLF